MPTLTRMLNLMTMLSQIQIATSPTFGELMLWLRGASGDAPIPPGSTIHLSATASHTALRRDGASGTFSPVLGQSVLPASTSFG
jgi:hypothetical protein